MLKNKKEKGSLVVAVLVIIAGLFLISVFIGVWKDNDEHKLTPKNVFTPTGLLSDDVDSGGVFNFSFQTPNIQTPQSNNPINFKYDCGIVLDSPLEGESLNLPFTIAGYLNGCGWTEVGGLGGTVEVVSLGSSVSDVVDLTVLDGFGYPKYFTATINSLENIPQTALLVFKNKTFGNLNTQSHQISIQFN